MKKLFTTLFFILFLTIILFCILGAFTLDPLYKTPLLIISGVLLILFLMMTLLRRYVIQKKVQSFIHRIITQNKATISNAPQSSQAELLALEKSWFDSIKKLKGSSLRTYGNPLYVLPWYLVIGESGTGKTSLLKHSGLSSPLSSLNSTPGLPGTRNCDWWFFNEAIVLDTAGRYTIPIDQVRDSQEWEQLLKNLSAFRKKEPINGIVVAISSDSLTKLSPQELTIHGQLVRSRIDQVMRILGSSFPVYIMITKMDLIFGMPEFFRALPQSRLGQAMGWCNSNGETYSDDLLNKAMNSVCDNLKQLQFAMFHNEQKPEAEILVFPQRFLELSAQLTTFCASLFSRSVYHVTPLFRGIYFSSALQKIEQGVMDKSAHEISAKALSGGLFLKEFFARVLPGDRKFHWHIPQYRQKYSRLLKIAFSAWGLLWINCIVLLLFSFLYTKKTLQPPQPSSIASDVHSSAHIEYIRSTVHNLAHRNNRLFPLRMGLLQGKTTETVFKSSFTKTFRKTYLLNAIRQTHSYIDMINDSTSIDSVMSVVNFLTSMINASRQPDPSTIFAQNVQTSSRHLPYTKEILPIQADQLTDWMHWEDSDTVSSLQAQIFSQLASLIDNKGSDLRWCTNFDIHGTDDITMKRFWSGAHTGVSTESGSEPQIHKVNGAFTRNGLEQIGLFLMHIDSALTDSTSQYHFKSKQGQFYQWYGEQYVSQWYTMTGNFVSLIDMSLSSGNYQRFFREISSGNDPFIQYLRYTAAQFDSTALHSYAPLWSSQVILLRDLERFTVKKEIRDSTTSFVRKVINAISGVTTKVTNSIKDVADEQDNIRRKKIEQAFPAWTSYRKELSTLGAFLTKPDGLSLFARGLFDMSDSTSSLYTNLADASSHLKQRLFSASADNIVWSIIDGPLSVIENAAYTQACRNIEQLWSKNILAITSQRDSDTYTELLFAPDSGLIRKFLEDPYVSAFIQTGPDGHIELVSGINGPLPVSQDFISFVNNGLGYNPQDVYTISLRTVPFSVNSDAGEKPYQMSLRLQCGDGDGILENFNNNEIANFSYRPSSCGRVTLKVIFPSFIAVKTWHGRWAFPKFLSAFKRGTVDLSLMDFDKSSQRNLEQINCTGIRLTYMFDTNDFSPIISLLDYISSDIPLAVTYSPDK